MATLTPASAAAIARLRSYIPPPTTWHSLPLTRRAAVLIVLFADKMGDLRVVLTMRAATLKSYAGQAALPGGKSDSLAESPFDTARREAWEEIGLPMPEHGEVLRDMATATATGGGPSTPAPVSSTISSAAPPAATLPYPFKLEHLCQLPANLAKTELGVRPCVAFLYATSSVDKSNNPVDVESMLIPRLDAKEVAAVFNARLHNFLKVEDEVPVPLPPEGKSKGKDKEKGTSEWYRGMWTDWHESKFRMHNFFVPVLDQVVTKPRSKNSKGALDAKAMAEAEARIEREATSTDQTTWKGLHGASSSSSPSSASSTLKTRKSEYPRPSSTIPYRDIPHPNEPDPLADLARFRVFGMTARILVDCARVAYAEEPEFEHNSQFGDETILQKLLDMGRMDNERSKGAEFNDEELSKVLSGPGETFGGAVGKRKRGQKEGDDRSRL